MWVWKSSNADELFRQVKSFLSLLLKQLTKCSLRFEVRDCESVKLSGHPTCFGSIDLSLKFELQTVDLASFWSGSSLPWNCLSDAKILQGDFKNQHSRQAYLSHSKNFLIHFGVLGLQGLEWLKFAIHLKSSREQMISNALFGQVLPLGGHHYSPNCEQLTERRSS